MAMISLLGSLASKKDRGLGKVLIALLHNFAASRDTNHFVYSGDECIRLYPQDLCF